MLPRIHNVTQNTLCYPEYIMLSGIHNELPGIHNKLPGIHN